MYIIFLDIDGVLASNRVQSTDKQGIWRKLDPIATSFLNYFSETFKDVYVVITSTWRYGMVEGPFGYHIAEALLATAGFRGSLYYPTWKTSDLGGPNPRPSEIKLFLDENPSVEDFLIFDDDSFDFETVLGEDVKVVKTDGNNGMLWEHMQRSKELTKDWKHA